MAGGGTAWDVAIGHFLFSFRDPARVMRLCMCVGSAPIGEFGRSHHRARDGMPWLVVCPVVCWPRRMSHPLPSPIAEASPGTGGEVPSPQA